LWDAGDFGACPPPRGPGQPRDRHLPVRAFAGLAADPSDVHRRAARRSPVGRLRALGHLHPRPGDARLHRTGRPSGPRVPSPVPGTSDRLGRLHGRRHPRHHDHPHDLGRFAGGPPRRPRQSTGGGPQPRRDAVGDDPPGRSAVCPGGNLRRRHPGTRSRRRRDDGRDDDDRQPGRLLRLTLRTGADDRQSDRESMARRRPAAGTRRAHPTGPCPHAGVPVHQPFRTAHGRPVPAGGGGGGMKFLFDRDTRRRWFDVIMSGATLLCVALALLPLGSILFEALVRGAPALTPTFLTQSSLMGGIVRLFVDVMTQTPSIVVGIFAYSFIFELSLLGFFPPPLVFSVISAVIALATIMIPIVARTSEEAMRLVPTSAREAALALGIPRYRTILRVVLPSCASALVTGALLGIARVGGETAPLIMTAAWNNDFFNGLDQPIAALPTQVYR